jgi:hypothetical protein
MGKQKAFKLFDLIIRGTLTFFRPRRNCISGKHIWGDVNLIKLNQKRFYLQSSLEMMMDSSLEQRYNYQLIDTVPAVSQLFRRCTSLPRMDLILQ